MEVVEIQTVGQLRPPSFQLSSTLLQSTPLGCVPGGGGEGGGLHPGLGHLPGNLLGTDQPRLQAGQDWDETEPLGSLTNTTAGRPADTQQQSGSSAATTTSSSLTTMTGLGTVPGLGTIPGLGTVPGLGTTSDLGIIPSSRSSPCLSSVLSSGNMPGLGTVPSMGPHPGLGTVPSLGPQHLGLDCGVGEPEKVGGQWDSGVTSGEYSESLAGRGAGDGGVDRWEESRLEEWGEGRAGSEEEEEEVDSVESALRHLNPADVERRRRLMGRNYRCVCVLMIRIWVSGRKTLFVPSHLTYLR